MSLVLDSEALSQLIDAGVSHVGVAGEGRPRGGGAARMGAELLAALQQARDRGMTLSTSAAVIAEQYQRKNVHAVSAFLNRNGHIAVGNTDTAMALVVGTLLRRAGRGSADHVDATVVAVALRGAPGASVIVTSDPHDIARLVEAAAPSGAGTAVLHLT